MGGTTAFMFPGQGSQFVGMGKAAYDAAPAARETFERADAALGFALSAMCFAGDEAELRRTENTQPAILTASLAAYRLLEANGARPDWVAGHSLGEYSALVAAGALSLEEAVCLVRNRGRYMQQAVPEGSGAMAAILGLEDDDVASVCAAIEADGGGVCSPANFNSPGQVVIAGHTAAVESAVELALQRGARRAMLLNVSAPFHCSLMAPAAEALAADLERVSFRDPAVPVMCNVDAAPLRSGDEIGDALLRQVTAPVRWADGLRAMQHAGVDLWVEVGPGKVLSGLLKRTIKPERAFAVGGPDGLPGLLDAI